MDRTYVGQLVPVSLHRYIFNTTFAPVANALVVFRETERATYDHVDYSYMVVATFMLGIVLGYNFGLYRGNRQGYLRGLNDGNPLLQAHGLPRLNDFNEWPVDL